jgi:hypothetical protein
VSFSNSFSNEYNEVNSEFFDNHIIILKKVKSLRHLRRTEKELVRLCYKEAIIKGFTLKGIQQYIASKTKIWIEWSCLEYLKKSEEQENREWYFRLAKDQFAYINIFRKAIDEIEEYKKELWLMVMDRKVERSTKVQAMRELHSLSKTYTLILKDLPFVTRLTKYYDKDIFSADYNYSDKRSSNNLEFETNLGKGKDIDNNKDKKIIVNNNLNSNPNPNKIKYIDDEVNEEMMRQAHMTDCLKGKDYEHLTNEDLEKVITPEYKEAIKRVKDLLDD